MNRHPSPLPRRVPFPEDAQPDREGPTLTLCPACNGSGLLRSETATTYVAQGCAVCAGTGMCTAADAVAWRLSQRLPPEP